MIYKLLKDGVVVNTIVADPAFVDAYAEAMEYTYEELQEPDPSAPPVEPGPTDTDVLNALLGVM